MQDIQPDLLHYPILLVRLGSYYFSTLADNLECYALYELY